MKLIHVVIDALQVLPDVDALFILHVTNNVGAWGAGFTGALSRIYPEVETTWRRAAKHNQIRLGAVHYVITDNEQKPDLRIVVANMCAQDGVGTDRQRVDYAALRTCLESVANQLDFAQSWGKLSVVMPKIGAGLGGGDWETIEGIIVDTLQHANCDVYVCTLPGK